MNLEETKQAGLDAPVIIERQGSVVITFMAPIKNTSKKKLRKGLFLLFEPCTFLKKCVKSSQLISFYFYCGKMRDKNLNFN